MTFETYLSLLVEYTENRRLILSRQSEAWSCFVQETPIEFAGEFTAAIGLPANNKRRNQS